MIQDALATDIQLTLSKLSDPAESRGKTNATAEHLLDEIRDLRTPACVDGLHGLLQSFIDACKPIREARNKMIAHLDRATALQMGQLKSVPRTTVAQVEAALRALSNFMNAAAEYLGEAPTAYELFMNRGEGGDDLISLLRMAERCQILQKRGRFRGMMCRTAERRPAHAQLIRHAKRYGNPSSLSNLLVEPITTEKSASVP